jgi:flagellar protein FliO/FliZ
MIKSIPLSRAAARAAILALATAALAPACPATAYTPSGPKGGESTPLKLPAAGGAAHASSGGASLTRTIVGLLIVIAVIWGLTWILRQVKSSRGAQAAGSGLASLSTLPLGSGRALHLVRAGSDYLLLGSAEHGVAPVHRYTEQQARDAGLLDEPEEEQRPGPPQPGHTIRMPGQGQSFGEALLARVREWTVRR